MVVIQAPVLSPKYSTIFEASGIELCTNPGALANTNTRRSLWGVAGALSGTAAIMAEISAGLANCFCGQPLVNPPLNPSTGHGPGACCAKSALAIKPPQAASLNLIMVYEN